MKLAYPLLITIISLVATNASMAAVSPSIDTQQMRINTLAESVLPPGAKILAGDPAKNEFYILGKDETPKARRIADRDSPHMQSTTDHSSEAPVTSDAALTAQSDVQQPITATMPALIKSDMHRVMQSATLEPKVKISKSVAVNIPHRASVTSHQHNKSKAQIAASIKMALAHSTKVTPSRKRNLAPNYVAAKKPDNHFAIVASQQKTATSIQVIRTTLHQTHYITRQAIKVERTASRHVSKPKLIAQKSEKHWLHGHDKLKLLANTNKSKQQLAKSWV
jgi:hypothetical protein